MSAELRTVWSTAWCRCPHEVSRAADAPGPGPDAARSGPVRAGPIWTRGALRGREVGAGNRGRRGRPWSARGPNAATTRSAGPGDFNPCRHRSCWRVAGGAGAARWCRERWWRCSTRGRTSRVAAPSRVRWSVIRTRGPSRPPLSPSCTSRRDLPPIRAHGSCAASSNLTRSASHRHTRGRAWRPSTRR
jgi:hypothetical protein